MRIAYWVPGEHRELARLPILFVNITMKPKIQSLFEQHKLKSRSDLHVALGYDNKNKSWKFIGWYCPKCQQGLKSQHNALKHRCSQQKVRLKKSDDYMDIAEIKTISGKPYKVFTI